MSQHSLQEPPQDPQKPCKSDELSSFFGFSLVLARSPPRSKKSRQDPPKSALKMPILGSMCAILATSWREVGQLSAILAPTWPILAPRCAPTGLRREPRARPNQHLGASWRQAARQEPPNLPGAYIFSRFCFHFGTDFVKKLLRMLWKTFVLFSLFPFHAKPGLTRPPQNEAKTRPRWTQDAYLSSSSVSLSKHLAKKVAT